MIKDENALICLEVDDDVSVRLKKGENIHTIFEQNKSNASKGKGNPFSNTNVNLWKSLSNWSELILEKNIKIEKSSFLLVTNVSVTDTTLIKQISKENDKTKRGLKVKELLEFAERTKSQEISDYLVKIKKLSDKQIAALFSRIDVIDEPKYKIARDDIRKNVRQNINIGSKLPFNSLYNNILGWLMGIAIEKWTNREPVIIGIDDFNNFLSDQIALNSKKTFVEMQELLLPVSDKQRSENSNKNFVKQLEWIHVNEEEIVDAIDDFLRSRWERKRFSLCTTRPTQPDFSTFEKSLEHKWRGKFLGVQPFAKSPEDFIAFGQSVYYNSISEVGYLAGQKIEMQYNISGTYHQLANDFKVGWHLDYERLKKLI
jgi:hypothetical protein